VHHVQHTAVQPAFRLSAPTPAELALHQAVADALAVLVMPPARWSTFPAGHVELPAPATAKLAPAAEPNGRPNRGHQRRGRRVDVAELDRPPNSAVFDVDQSRAAKASA